MKLAKMIIWAVLCVVMLCVAVHSLIVKDYWLFALSSGAFVLDIIDFNASLKEWKQSK